MLLILAIFATGCAAEVRHLTASYPQVSAQKPYRLSLEVAGIAGKSDAAVDRDKHWEGGLIQALRDTRAFSVVFADALVRDEVDLVVRGTVSHTWHPGGFKNFMTYWPGGLIFAPAWRGTKWQFDLEADLQLIEAKTGNLLDQFVVSTSHQLVHRSPNPAHFLGAVVIIPGLLRGATVTWPRTKYKQMVYDEAYPVLWRQAARQIVIDRDSQFLALQRAADDHCGDRRGRPPAIGETWNTFSQCQGEAYRRTGERSMERGVATIYESSPARWRIFVVEGAIAQWEEAVRPAVSAGSP